MSTVSGLGNRRRHGITGVKFAANPMKLSLINVARNNNKRKQKRNHEIEMRHKKRNRCFGGNNIGLSNSTSGFDDDSAIVCEILSRLPVKSLVRFKCVCKRWRFLIEEDSYFIDLHLNQSKKHPKLFSIVPIPNRYSRMFLPKIHKVELVTVNLMLEGREASTTSVRTVRKIEFPPKCAGCFGPVNGLIGCDSKKNSSIRIFNMSTEEVTPWIKSTMSRNIIDIERIPYYEMGFDPFTKKNKVMCIWDIIELKKLLYHDNVCEVLTVGDNKWRRIENPPFELKLERYQRRYTLYLNGIIYYCTSKFMKAGELDNDKIVAFDVGAEKFRSITVPDFILNQPRHVYEDGSSSNNLIEVEGRLALLSRMNDYTAKLWVFGDVHGNNIEKSAATSSSSNQNWTEVSIELPYLWSEDLDIHFHSVLGKGLVIIESHCKNKILAFHFYSWITKSCEKIDISGFKYCRPSTSRVATLVESLFRVK